MIHGWKMHAALDYLRYAKYVKISKTPKKTYAGVI